MQLLRLALLCFLVGIVFGCGRSDSSLEQNIIGRWKTTSILDNGGVIQGMISYSGGGIMTFSATASYQGREREVTGSGTWKVVNGYLQTRIETSTAPDDIPNGFTVADKIVSVSKRELITINSKTGLTDVTAREE